MDDFLKILRKEHLTELYVPESLSLSDELGRAGRKALPHGTFVAYPLSVNVYLELGPQLVRLRSIEQYSRLSVAPVKDIECPFEIDPDDGYDGFAVTSLLRFALQSGRDSVKVTKLDAFLEEGCDPSECMFVALGLACDSGDYIFFDPLGQIDGIHIGATRSRELWESYWGRNPNFTYTVRSYDVG
jgi:hypothetical protein